MFRDPRFDDLSGEYKPQIFEKTYKFINDIKHREKVVREPRTFQKYGSLPEEHLLISCLSADGPEATKENKK